MTTTWTAPGPGEMTRWYKATLDLREDIFQKAYEVELDRIFSEAVKSKRIRAAQEPTEAMKKKASHIADGEVTRKLYKLEEHNGVRNPTYDDPEWGYGARKAEDKARRDEAKKVKAELDPLADWLEAQTWSEFALSLAAQYRQKGSLSPKQIASAKSMKAKVEARQKARDEKPETGIDLADLPSGYYAVPGGETRLKVRVAHGKPGTKWDGWTFVSDGAEYGARKNYGSQRPGNLYKGDIEEQLRAILADPFEAQKAYGKLWGVCGACGRMLEDEDSIAAGIGPICAQKW